MLTNERKSMPKVAWFVDIKYFSINLLFLAMAMENRWGKRFFEFSVEPKFIQKCLDSSSFVLQLQLELLQLYIQNHPIRSIELRLYESVRDKHRMAAEKE